MEFNVGIFELVGWVSFVFPTMAGFLKTMVPLLFCAISVIGVFSNILPEPGVIYEVPTLDEIELELKHRSRLIYWLTCISRQITVGVNRLTQSRVYWLFYAWTNLCSRLVEYFRGGIRKSKFIKLSDPTPYKPDWKQLNDDVEK